MSSDKVGNDLEKKLGMPRYAKLLKLAKECSLPGYSSEVESIAEKYSHDSKNDALKEIAADFFERKLDQSEFVSDELKKFMIDANEYFRRLSNTDTFPAEDMDIEINRGQSTRQDHKSTDDSARPSPKVDIDNQSPPVGQMDQQSKRFNDVTQGAPVSLDLFGSLITSFSSIWNTKKKLAGATASYLGEQARIEFGSDEAVMYRPLFGEGKRGNDFSRHDAVLDRLELAGRRFEEGRQVNIDAVRRDMDYLKTSMDATKDNQALSIEDMDRAKRTKEVIEEFTARAGKKASDDPQQKQRLEEIIKSAQDVGRMLSTLIGRMAEKIKSMMGADDEAKAETEQNTPARLRL